ncbi:hypothetical protein OXPF_19570 [Oxobacter pfennigii]|uniref:DUF1847 domain-containing protein n=1 Tax=Oxobacter pfennigii TaxID=36849 RepID=A0A0P8W700_9CLOT|nr:DUF1847 domain-containing protein [Oxobacter pfennigii]KPU44463.1 hypothetical protein OXPF_19570 [Oxobacter pfennigii]
MPEEKQCRSCADCGLIGCTMGDKRYPEFCLTAGLDERELAETVALYINNRVNKKIALAAAEVEGGFYGRLTRVEEIMEFARRIGAKKIGIATCVGLMAESRTFAKMLRAHGFEVYGAACKVGAVKKPEIGIGEAYIMREGESMCNPIMQAKLLNKAKTDLNVVVGLCVGHDSLFYKYSKAATTTLITKDRLTCHNPAAPLYLTDSYYKKLLQGDWPQETSKKLPDREP